MELTLMKKILFVFILVLSISCTDKKSNPLIEVYNTEVNSVIDINAELEILADSLLLPEGPVWNKESDELLFVDNLQNKVLSWSPIGGIQDYIVEAGNTGYAPNLGNGLLGPNGLALDNSGNLFICQVGDRRVAKISIDSPNKKDFTTVADSYQGNRLNSPNDIIVSKEGDIYFTDPAFAFFDPQKFEFVESELRELDFNGVFKLSEGDSRLIAVDDGPGVPNGLGLSPDEKFLYVNKMGAPFSNSDSEIRKIDLNTNQSETLFNGNDLVAKYNNGTDFDGMDVHSSGLIFTAGPGGLLVISSEGELMARINTGQITNCTFNDDESYLYVTGFLNNPRLYRIKMNY
jgi:gluconolactonase